MKRIGNLYEKIIDTDNIKQGILNASKGKKKRKKVQQVLNNLDESVKTIQELLIDESYIPSPYTKSKIKDGIRQKERIIHKPKFFPDQCIHWCIVQIVENIFQRRNV